MTRAFAFLPAVLVAAVAACSNPEPKPSTEPAPGPTPTVQRKPIGQLPAIDVEAVLAHTTALSSDQYEGRGPGTEGEELTITYLVDQFRKMGVKPGNADGTFTQKVPLVGITPTPAPLVLHKDGVEYPLAWRDDVVAWSKHVAESAALEHPELVLVGYGIVAPEFNADVL